MFSKRIITIHALDEKTLSPVDFVKYIEVMQKIGYKFVSLEEIVSSDCKGLKLALTIDDAYKCVVTNLLPILQQYGIVATLFVPPGLLGLEANDPLLISHNCYKDHDMMSVEDLRVWCDAGMKIGFHTNTHINMRDGFSECEIDEEFRRGLETLSVLGYNNLEHFAYPFGFTPKNKDFIYQLMKKYGFKYAYTITAGDVNIKDPFVIPRVCLGNKSSLYWNVFKTLGLNDFYNHLKRKKYE